jgi:pectate lyase
MFRTILCRVLLPGLTLGLLAGVGLAEPSDGQRFLAGARRFADRVLADGRDRYGPEKTPLFVDGLDAKTLEPLTWQYKNATWVLSNFASQQPLLRLLDGLTGLTGEPKYRRAAEEVTRYALQHLATPNGLLAWGGHQAWDLQGERPVGPQCCHELKFNRPYFKLFWRVDPKRTAQLIETIWAAHILDWSLLDYNRHASLTATPDAAWNHPFKEDVAVPFPAVGKNLAFLNTSVSMVHAGAALAVLGHNADALKWTGRLVYRWQQGKDAKTGLCGQHLSFHPPETDRAQIALRHVHPDICEAKIVPAWSTRYHEWPLAQLQDGQGLVVAGGPYAELGHEMIRWASDDLKIYAERCYDSQTGQFIARMTDGTAIQWRQSHHGYFKPQSFAPQKPDGLHFWAYATAWRLTRDATHWRMVRAIAGQLGLGELGEPGGRRALKLETACRDYRVIYALLELHEATGDEQVLRLACRVGQGLLKMQAPSGLFPREGHRYARTGDEVPLALLHLAAAMEGKRDALPPVALDRQYFHAAHDREQEEKSGGRIYDLRFYGPQ